MPPYDIQLRKDAQPYHARAYPIPQAHVRTLKVEVDRLCEVGVLKKVNRSEWAAPTFIIPKKDGSVRFISDFREESAQEERNENDRAKPKATSRYTKQKNASLELKTEYKKINTLTVVTIKHMMETEPTDKKFPNLWEEFLDGYFRYVWAVKAKKCEDIEKMNGQGKRKQPKERVKDSDEVCEDFLTSMGYAF